jgi:glucan phosphoethanolaminetransferase (alkaline phosphatase superfamily)
MSLEETPQTNKRNVVLIHLESARARSLTPYNQELKTTPFLEELAKKSLLVERAYTTLPRTSKAMNMTRWQQRSAHAPLPSSRSLFSVISSPGVRRAVLGAWSFL